MSEDEIQPKRGRPFRRVENGFEDMPERVKALVAAAEAKRNRIAGAKMLWVALRYIAAAGGGAAIFRALCAG